MSTVSKTKRKKIYEWLFLLLVVIFFANLFFRIFQYKDNYLKKFDGAYWEHRYQLSQWVVPNSKSSIGDDGLYAYAGYKYVFFGMNPILNSAEVPPLGKYLIGVTIAVFNNQNIFGLLTGISSLFAFYLLNLILFKKKLIAFLPIFVFSLEPLFWEQLQANYLDLLYLTFLFMSFYFVIKRKYFLSTLFIGCFAATKFPPTSIFVALSVFVYVFVHQCKDMTKLLMSFSLWPLVFVISYARFFMLGNGPIAFLKVLKYFIHYYQIGVKSENHIMVFDLLLKGKWATWWGGGVLNVPEWSILWPLAFLLTILSVGCYRKILKSPFLLIFSWIILYLGFLIIIPVAPRYLLLLLPFLYNISVWVLSEGINMKYLRRSGFFRSIFSSAS